MSPKPPHLLLPFLSELTEFTFSIKGKFFMISLLSAPLCLQAISKSTKVTSRNPFDLMAVNMLAKVAAKWLMCHLQCGHPEQGDNTYLRRAWPELAHASQNGMRFQTYNFFISELSISYFKTKDYVSSCYLR